MHIYIFLGLKPRLCVNVSSLPAALAVSALVCVCFSRAPAGLREGFSRCPSPSSPTTATAPVSEQVKGEGTGTVTSLCCCSLGHLHTEAGQCWDPPWYVLERNPPSPGGREQWLHGSLHFLFIRKPYLFPQPYPGPGGLRGAGGIVSLHPSLTGHYF